MATRTKDLEALPPVVGGLTEQLDEERSHRPTQGVTPTLESVMAASGLPFGATRQALGRTTLALYCASADSPAGLTVTVCEYPGVEQAQRGLTAATAVRGKMTGWQATAAKQSVLELLVRPDTPKEKVDAVRAAFEKL
ncbi:MAG: hypothetical protein SFW67_25605 [Myxococcaceae bacterium]|nr:hypothetical protein [Myxococcaceae bacterium]